MNIYNQINVENGDLDLEQTGVCLNGHYVAMGEKNCPCGTEAIGQCPECMNIILRPVGFVGDTPDESCKQCGASMPWSSLAAN